MDIRLKHVLHNNNPFNSAEVINLSSGSQNGAGNLNHEDEEQESQQRFSDFSINKILSDRGDSMRTNGGDNRQSEVTVRSWAKRRVPEVGVDLSSSSEQYNNNNNRTLANNYSIISNDYQNRPMNKAFDSPWSYKGPVIFSQKFNTFYNESTLIAVQSQKICFNFNHPRRQFNDLNDLLYPTSRAIAAAAAKDLVVKAETDSTDMASNGASSAYDGAAIPPNSYQCPCKQCENGRIMISPLVEDGSDGGLSVFKARYECEECGKGFSQLRNYKYHLSIHKGTKEFAANCPECGKMFNDKGRVHNLHIIIPNLNDQ